MICKEKAAFVLRSAKIDKENVKRKYRALSIEKQRLFDELKSKEDGGDVCDIFLNNAINTDDDQFGIFLTIARVNHSCCPNAGIEKHKLKCELQIHFSLGEQRGRHRGDGAEVCGGDPSRRGDSGGLYRGQELPL